MGVDVCTYRARIGRFLARHIQLKQQFAVWLRSTAFFGYWRPGCRLLVVLFSVAHILLCAGDIETNPGPDKVEQLLVLVKDIGQTIDKFQKETSSKLKDLQTTITDTKRRLSKIEGRLDVIDVLRKDVTSVNEVLQESHAQLKSLETKQTEQADLLVDDLNNRMRRNNLVFKGIPEQTAEKWKDTEKIVSEFVTQHLGIQSGEIERAHRVGRVTDDRVRPIVVKFLNFKDKSSILRNAYKLQKSSPRVWVEEDFSPRIQMIRKKLRDFVKVERKPGEKYKLLFDKVLLGNRLYGLGNTNDSTIVQIPRHEPRVNTA